MMLIAILIAGKETIIMAYARKGTITFAIMQHLAQSGASNMDQIVLGIRDFSVCRRSRVAEILGSLQKSQTVLASGDVFILSDEAISYVEDVLELAKEINTADLVPTPYANAFTPEMQNYDGKLFENKRGYKRKEKKNDAQ
jgi:enoyl-[acyl-carrier-protein] reductase (NADH)